MKTSAGNQSPTLWKRFCEDEEASINGPGIVLAILLFMAIRFIAA